MILMVPIEVHDFLLETGEGALQKVQAYSECIQLMIDVFFVVKGYLEFLKCRPMDTGSSYLIYYPYY